MGGELDLQLEIEVLTPVHIWNGDEISPYIDYIEEDEVIHLVNQDKIFEEINKYEDSYEAYIRHIKNNSKKSDKVLLKDFLKQQRISVDKVTDFSIKLRCEAKSTVIKLIMKELNKPYIAGSSIKGLLRTALLLHWYRENGKNPDLEHIIKNQGIKNKKIDILRAGYNYVGQDVFRDRFNNIQSDMFRFLQVSDSGLFDNSCLNVIKEENINLESYSNQSDKEPEYNTNLHVVTECIRENSKSTFSLKITRTEFDGLDKVYIDKYFKWFAKNQEEVIFSIVNDMSEKNILLYIERLEKLDHDKFKNIINLYHRLLKDIKELKKSKEGCIFRLGSHKNFYDQTIYDVLKDGDKKSIRDIVGSSNSDDFFPATEWFVVENRNITTVPGWIKISKMHD